MDVERRLRALDDAVLGDRVRRPLPPNLQRNGFLFGLLAVLTFCVVFALFGDGIPYDVMWPWLLIVLMSGGQWRRSRAGNAPRRRS
jgi:hypothetical protein